MITQREETWNCVFLRAYWPESSRLFSIWRHWWLSSVVVLQAALLNSPRQRRKGQKGTPTMKGSITPGACQQCQTLALYVLGHG